MNPPTTLDRDLLQRHGIESYKLLKGARAYALNDKAKDGLAALVAASVEKNIESGARSFSREDFAEEVLKPLAKVIPGLVQARPEDEPTPVKPWKDEITGEPAKNPFSDPPDFASCRVLMERDPALAQHLKACAGGVSYLFLATLEDERRIREQMRTLPYSAKEHEENPFRGDNMQKQSDFANRVHPAAVEFYKAEAIPVEVPFSNRTIRGRIETKAQHLGPVIDRAQEIFESWAQQDFTALRNQKAEAEKKLNEAIAEAKARRAALRPA